MIKVSIVIPTYNRFQYLMTTIDSIKKQTYNNISIYIYRNDKSKYSYTYI